MKNKLFAFVLFIVPLLFNECASVNSIAREITVESGQIPPGMETDTFTLIVLLEDRNSCDKHIKKEFRHYSGKYLLVNKYELGKKYPDEAAYRYYLSYDETFMYVDPHTRIKKYSYYIYDRLKKIRYTKKPVSNYWPLEIKAYVLAIDSTRKK